MGDGVGAARLYGAITAQRQRHSLRRSPRETERWDALGGELRQAIGDAAFAGALADGEPWELQDAIQQALVMALRREAGAGGANGGVEAETRVR